MSLPLLPRLGRRILLGAALILAPTSALAGGSAIGGVAASMMAADFDPAAMDLHRRMSPLQPFQATVHLRTPPMPLEALVMLMYSVETGHWSRAGMRRATLTRVDDGSGMLVLDAVLDLPRGDTAPRGMDTAQVVGTLEALAGILATAPQPVTLHRVEMRPDSVQVDLLGQDAHVARETLDRIESAAAFDHVRPVRLQLGAGGLAVRLRAGLSPEEEAVAAVEPE